MHQIVPTNSNYTSEQITRVVFQGFSSSAVVFFYVIATLSISLFLWNSFIEIRKYMRGKKPVKLNSSSLRRSIQSAFSVLLTHRSIRRRDKPAGWMHALIFFGFITL
ncbi:MAG: hypothetical protein KGL58_08550, partial [Pseudomonadota bacterium]|nr:hypothetical protein [Pseudomonadota bacterium]